MSTSGQKRIESTIDTAIDCDEDEVMELAMQAGELLLENGAEIFRVEETMDRICRHYGVESASQFILMNYILATAGEGHGHMFAKVRHIPVNGSHLDKVAAVNQLSREIAEGKYTVSEAYQALETIRRMPDKRKSVLILASGVASGAFCYLFGGNLMDCLAAAIAGFLIYVYILYISGPHLSKIVGNVGGGAFVTLVCNLLYMLGLGDHLNFMIIGSMMPLVPGVAFTVAIRDAADGDYISGTVRMIDALLVVICIAIGVGMGIAVLKLLTGGADL